MALYAILICVIVGVLYCECKETENEIGRNSIDGLVKSNGINHLHEFAEDNRSRNGRQAIHFKQPLKSKVKIKKVRTRQFDLDKAQRRYSTLNSNQIIRRPVQQFYYNNKRQIPYAPRPRPQPQATRVTSRATKRPTQKRKMKPPRIMF
ncbi:unnamed protein product [Callosobruchus maculatus]|uniref:Secreted protein n=1 Tax=Callosobruchus maculatus TaxID=64391 RepID=A0A653BSH3_CALMS|nr:unnamed protein product [Callosobruchus maculatus]